MDLGHIAVVQAEFVREKPHVVGVKVPEKHSRLARGSARPSDKVHAGLAAA